MMLNSEPSLAQQIDTAIASSPHLSNRRLRIEMQNGRVVLLGTVPSYYQKQMAQEAVRRIQGIEVIDNRLTVSA
ncbi:MAG: BON domain-containing protein [Pirellulaceae bacterium]